MTNNIFAAADSNSNTNNEEDNMCENLSFRTMCSVPFLDELTQILGSEEEECNHDVFGGWRSFCAEKDYSIEEECDYVGGKCMIDFPCAENEVAMLLECWSQVNLNHLLHEAEAEFWD